ncbi:MAG: hypothetical protein H7343_08175 [Undibacterium sp.]|nr:hypothetical protein [Opitutaceae bacterium]
MEVLNLLQWPAMICSVVAAWLVGAQTKRRRTQGFWWFLMSNLLWSVWGWQSHAWAIIALQVALAGLNFRGLAKNHPAK